jgi:hypothetical protein
MKGKEAFAGMTRAIVCLGERVMAKEQKPSIDNNAREAVDELDEYGIWVKAAPEDIHGRKDTLVESSFTDDFTFEEETITEEAALFKDVAVAPKTPGVSLGEELVIDEDFFNFPEGELLKDDAGEPDTTKADAAGPPPAALPEGEPPVAALPEPEPQAIELSTGEVADTAESPSGSSGTAPEDPAERIPIGDSATALLSQIADELLSIRNEIASLKKEITIFNRQPAQPEELAREEAPPAAVPAVERSTELHELISNGIQPLADVPIDTSYLDEDAPPPELLTGISSAPEEAALDELSIDFEVEEDLSPAVQPATAVAKEAAAPAEPAIADVDIREDTFLTELIIENEKTESSEEPDEEAGETVVEDSIDIPIPVLEEVPEAGATPDLAEPPELKAKAPPAAVPAAPPVEEEALDLAELPELEMVEPETLPAADATLDLAELSELKVEEPAAVPAASPVAGPVEKLAAEEAFDLAELPELEVVEPEDLEELEELEPVEAAEPEKTAASEPAEPSDKTLPSDFRKELKSVLQYMDHLLESLPESKIEEFAQSEYYETYKKVFEELGLA